MFLMVQNGEDRSEAERSGLASRHPQDRSERDRGRKHPLARRDPRSDGQEQLVVGPGAGMAKRYGKPCRRHAPVPSSQVSGPHRLPEQRLSHVVVELELVRVRAQPDRVDLGGALVVDPRLDQVGREDVARGEVVVVGLEASSTSPSEPGTCWMSACSSGGSS